MCFEDAALLNPIGRGRSTKHHLDRALQLKVGGDLRIIDDSDVWRQPLVRDGVPFGGQPARERDAGRRPILEIVNSLHESLPERRLADERPSVVISNRPGDNFGGAGCTTVDQHDQRQVKCRLTAADNRLGDQIVVVLKVEVLVESGAGIFGNKTADHLLSAGHPPAAVATQIKHDPSDALLLGSLQRRIQLPRRVVAEDGNRDMRDFAVGLRLHRPPPESRSPRA